MRLAIKISIRAVQLNSRLLRRERARVEVITRVRITKLKL